jgi:hypothetical protein
MKYYNPITWWKSLPQNTRVRILVGICLSLAGIEFWFIAPHVIEMSLLVDTLGWTFALAAMRTSFVLWALQIRDAWLSVYGTFSAVYSCGLGQVKRLQVWWTVRGYELSLLLHRVFHAFICRATLVALCIAACRILCRVISDIV